MSYKTKIEKFPTFIRVADINNYSINLLYLPYELLALKLSEFINNPTVNYNLTYEDSNLIKLETYTDNYNFISARNLLTYPYFDYFRKTKVYENFKTSFDKMVLLDALLTYKRPLEKWGFIVRGNSFKFAPYQFIMPNTIENDEFNTDERLVNYYINGIKVQYKDKLQDIIENFNPINELDEKLLNSNYKNEIISSTKMIKDTAIKFLNEID